MEKPVFKDIKDCRFFEDHEREDREVLNNYYRAQTYYYANLGEIYERISNVMQKMSDNEIKEIIKNKYINPVKKIDNF